MAAPPLFVRDLVSAIEGLGCNVWLDGGWAVDALLGKETRPHDDVDIVVEEQHLHRIRALLDEQGFKPYQRDDTRAWNFVLADDKDQQVDFHVIVFDESGNGIYGPAEHGKFYPAEAFTGRGSIAGMPVRCMSLAFQIANHSGYELRDKDHHDLALLQARLPA